MQGGAGLIVAESVHDDSRAPRLVESPEAILRRAAGRFPVEGPEAQRTAVGILQHFLDEYLKNNAGEIDYIHDDDALIGFAKQENAIGFLLPAMEKSQLFRGVIADGVLPRKTFSMGHSREKRYYLEGRKIK